MVNKRCSEEAEGCVGNSVLNLDTLSNLISIEIVTPLMFIQAVYPSRNKVEFDLLSFSFDLIKCFT